MHPVKAPQKVCGIAGEVGVLVRLSKYSFSSSDIHTGTAIRHEQVRVFCENSLKAPLVHIHHTLEAGPVVVFVVHARMVPVGHVVSHVVMSDKNVHFVVNHKVPTAPKAPGPLGARVSTKTFGTKVQDLGRCDRASPTSPWGPWDQ